MESDDNKATIVFHALHSSDTIEAPHTWTRSSTLQFLKLYGERKDRFLNKQFRKRELWHEVLLGMELAGFTGLSIDGLDRKMRNMKKTYRQSREHVRSGSCKTIRWEYYNTLDEIFGEEENEKQVAPPAIEAVVWSDESSVPSPEMVEEIFSNINEITVEEEEDPITFSPTVSKKKRPLCSPVEEDIKESFQNQLIYLEKKRIKAIALVAQKMDVANKIQTERNALLREYLNRLK